MSRKVAWIFFVLVFIMTGCGKQETTEPLSESAAEETVQYQESSEVFHFSREYCPFQLAGLSEAYFYFFQDIVSEDNPEHWVRTFYRHGFSKDSVPESMNLSLENMIHTTFSVEASEDGKDRIYLLLPNYGEQHTTYSIAVYDENGNLGEEIALEEEAFAVGGKIISGG